MGAAISSESMDSNPMIKFVPVETSTVSTFILFVTFDFQLPSMYTIGVEEKALERVTNLVMVVIVTLVY
jgi:energy-converting hydrogenase Eha subunit E